MSLFRGLRSRVELPCREGVSPIRPGEKSLCGKAETSKRMVIMMQRQTEPGIVTVPVPNHHEFQIGTLRSNISNIRQGEIACTVFEMSCANSADSKKHRFLTVRWNDLLAFDVICTNGHEEFRCSAKK